MDQEPEQLELIRYRVGAAGFTNVASYDQIRYCGRANEYKQAVMANAYRRLIGPLKGKRLLDVGCGTGRGVLELGREAKLAIGADASPDMLRFAATKAKTETRCGFATAYAQHLPFADGTFDVVIALNFLHLFSLETQRSMITEMKRVAKVGGLLVLEFDNALHGVLLGLYKRWFRDERGTFPWEARRVIGDRVKIEKVYGAVFPAVWRVLSYVPSVSAQLEKLAWAPPFNRLSHRVYYKLVKSN